MNVISETSTTVIDKITGEIVEETQSKIISVKKSEKESFFMTFIEHIGIVYKLKYVHSFKILTKFCQMAEYDKNEVNVPTAKRQQIIQELGLNESAWSRGLKELKKVGLISGDKGVFILNPSVYWKGTAQSRINLMKAGCKITIEPEFELNSTTIENSK